MMMDPINLEPTVEKIAQPQKPQANTSIEIIPVIYEIIRSIEKDPQQQQDCAQKVLELQKRFENVRNHIKQLPGIDYNREEQLQKLETLRNQLVLKQNLIKKYKDTVF